MLKATSFLAIIGLLLLVGVSFLLVKPFLISLFLGGLIAYALSPVYKRIILKINRPTIVSVLFTISILLLILVPITFFLQALVGQAYNIYIEAEKFLADGFILNCQNTLCQNINSFLARPEVHENVRQGVATVTSYIFGRGAELLGSASKLVLNLFVLLFAFFYFLRDGESIIKRFNEYLHLHQTHYSRLVERLKEIVRGVVFGYLIVALIQGTLGAIGFFLFGVPSALFWGMVMAFLALIPYLGTGIVWIPASLYLVSQGMMNDSTSLIIKGIGLFVYGLIIISSLDNLLRPFFIGGKAKVHPTVIMIGIFGGLYLFGTVGVIMGPLILSFTVAVLDFVLREKSSLSKP